MLRKTKRKISIPVGIEKVLYRAAIDPAFRDLLLADRKKAVESEHMMLSPSEMTILGNVSASALRIMIDRIKPLGHGRKKFMKSVAAAVVTLASGTAAIACDCQHSTCGGIMPDYYEDRVDLMEEQDIIDGVRPDVPEEVVETADVPDDSEFITSEPTDVPQDEAVAPDGEDEDGEDMDGEDAAEEADAGDAADDDAEVEDGVADAVDGDAQDDVPGDAMDEG
ncbi:MAG: hypothetical protein ABIJ56_00315 [Pseudomonadota bacterium]